MTTKLPLFVVAVVCVSFVHKAGAAVCTNLVSNTVSTTDYYYTSCGWWGFGRCQRERVTYRTTYESVARCCVGSFGRTESGCIGECPYSSPQASSACPNNGMCRDYMCVKSGFGTSNPTASALTFNENDNGARLLWNASATCFVGSRCNCSTERFTSSGSCTCSAAVPCTQCSVQSSYGIAEVRNGREIWRKNCSRPDCKVCTGYTGCLDYSATYQITVQCSATGYDDNDQVTKALNLTVTKAQQPVITITPTSGSGGGSNSVQVMTNARVGDPLLHFDPITIPATETNPMYILKGPNSTAGVPLFKYNATTGNITVNSDLSQATPGNYTLQLCVVLRRGETCANFTISIREMTTTTTKTTATTTTPTTTTTKTTAKTTTPTTTTIKTTATTTTPTTTKTTAMTTTPTTKTAKTTTVTTRNTTTIPPEEEDGGYVCFGIGIWRTIPGFDYWCSLVCGDIPTTCPYLNTHCQCIDTMLERQNCTSVAISGAPTDASYKRYMDAWCEVNCNYGQYSNCPREYCTCQ